MKEKSFKEFCLLQQPSLLSKGKGRKTRHFTAVLVCHCYGVKTRDFLYPLLLYCSLRPNLEDYAAFWLGWSWGMGGGGGTAREKEYNFGSFHGKLRCSNFTIFEK